MLPVKNIVILISGRGSNMEAIIRAAQTECWESQLDARIAAVVSNRPNAPGLAIAQSLGIPTAALDHKAYPSREDFDAALVDLIDQYSPDLVVLAGFMRVLGARVVCHYEHRLLNIHPSLLPSFSGLDTHRRALIAGVKLHGTTVHFVTPELDAGPIIIQAAVPILPTDDEKTLAERVLQQEHLIYPRAIRWCVQNALSINHGIVHQRDGEPQFILGTT